MRTIDSALSLSTPASNAAKTSAALPESLATIGTRWIDDAWNGVQDKLIELAPRASDPPERIDEEGYLLPTAEAIVSASRLAAHLRDKGEVAPSRVIEDAIGGIVLEWRSGKCAERVSVNRRGEREVARFRDSELVYRAYLRR